MFSGNGKKHPAFKRVGEMAHGTDEQEGCPIFPMKQQQLAGMVRVEVGDFLWQ